MFALKQFFALGVIAGSFVSSATVNSNARPASSSRKAVDNVVSVAPFTSIELRNGGEAVVRYGTTQRVTLIKGSSNCTEVTVTNGDRLIIDNTGRDACPRGYELQIEIITPHLKGLAVANGGLLQSLGDFPGETALSLAVNQGGVLDVRSITVDSVLAAVKSGGRILARPRISLAASVADGGVITYWGNPTVTSATRHGGIINKGTAADANAPVSDSNQCASAIPNAPAAPPAPVRRSFWW